MAGKRADSNDESQRRSDYKQRLEHRRVHREHLAWIEDVDRWRQQYRTALVDLARRLAGWELELARFEGELERHEAAIHAHEDLVRSHEQAIAFAKRGGQETPAEYESVHDQMDARHERSRKTHARLERRHRELLEKLADFDTAREGRRPERAAREVSPARRLAELLREQLATPLGERLAQAAEVAHERQVEIWLVGGAVRDLYLTGEIRDLDLLVAGDAAALARELARRLDGRLEVHPEFLTAGVVDREGVRIDLAEARSEEYLEPAALPVVAPGRVEDDLARRDFTVNALALGLDAERRFRLLDLFGGVGDLEARLLRALHERSFEDDPTRILRGLRLEHRLGLSFEPGTAELLRQAMERRFCVRLSGSRLWRELELLLQERGPVSGRIERLAEVGMLAEIHPRLGLESELRQLTTRLDAALLRAPADQQADLQARAGRLCLLAFAWPLWERHRRELAERLQLDGATRRLALEGPEKVREALRVLAGDGVRPHEVDALLRPLGADELFWLEALGDRATTAWVGRWRRELRRFELTIGGEDLVSRGAVPGPHIGRALEATRQARLDGLIGSAEELDFALSRLAESKGVAIGESEEPRES